MEECGELAVEGVKSCNDNDHSSKGGGEPEKSSAREGRYLAASEFWFL